jgi:hypothetical protein
MEVYSHPRPFYIQFGRIYRWISAGGLKRLEMEMLLLRLANGRFPLFCCCLQIFEETKRNFGQKPNAHPVVRTRPPVGRYPLSQIPNQRGSKLKNVRALELPPCPSLPSPPPPPPPPPPPHRPAPTPLTRAAAIAVPLRVPAVSAPSAVLVPLQKI